MIPSQFIQECEARGGHPWDEWHVLGNNALRRLVAVARSSEDRAVSLPESRIIAEEMFSQYGEEIVTSMTMQNLSYGIGCQLWDMKFYQEDGTPIPDEEAWDEVRRHLNADPEDPEWPWGRDTIIRWVLRSEAEVEQGLSRVRDNIMETP